MPILSAEQQHSLLYQFRMLLNLFLNLLQNVGFSFLSLSVALLQLLRKRHGFFHRFRQQQRYCQLRRTKPPSCIDAWGKRKGKIGCRQRLSLHPSQFQQCQQARTFGIGKQPQPLLYQKAIFSCQRNHIGNRCNRCQVAELFQRKGHIAAVHRCNEFQCQSCPTKQRERGRAIHTMRVYYGNRCWQCTVGLMVVSNHQPHALFCNPVRFL